MEANEVSTKVVSSCREFSVAVTKSHETETFVMVYYAYETVWTSCIGGELRDLIESANMWCFARFCTIRTIYKTWKTPMEECYF